MADLHINLLGQFQVSLVGEVVSGFVSDKARALLAYLAAENHYPHRRETLAHLLWPDKSDSRARANLRSALTNLRKTIGDAAAESSFLLVTHHDIQFNLASRVWLDVEILDDIYSLNEATKDNIARYHQALDIYQGEFLTGFTLPDSLPFDEWAIMKREQFSRKMIAILQQAIRYYEDIVDYEAALKFAWRLVELEPWQERARRQLMRLLLHTGRRDEALQQYHDLESALKSELNISPGAKTEHLYESILEGRYQPVSLPEFLLEEEQEILPPETFVARQQELDRLHSYLDKMLEGQGGIVMVAGEAGSGKTMLVQEFIRQAQARYPDLVSAVGYSNAFTGVGDPYLPFREILYQLSGDIETHRKAGSFSRQFAFNLWETVPFTCQALLACGLDLIGTIIPGQALLNFTQSYAAAQPAWYARLVEHLRSRQQFSGGLQQANLFSQLAAVLQKISTDVPLLLFLDDLQWADTGTIGMLFQLVKHISRNRILLVGAYRSEEVGYLQEGERHPLIPVLHEVQSNYGDVFIRLDSSSGKDFVQALVLNELDEIDQAFYQQLYLLTGGHALFTVELLRSLKESGALIQDSSGGWGMQPDFLLDTLPPRTEGIIAQRISRLPQNLQRILSLASIEGEIFTAEIIASIEDLSVSEVVSLVSNQLDKQHHLVRPLQVSTQGDRSISTYRFRHFLFQKYLYDRLDDIQRVRLHHQVGIEMEKLAGEHKIDYAVHMARHFKKADRPEKAYTYYALAGERAAQMSAFPEAINHLEAAIASLLSLPEDAARNEIELGLQLQLGLAYQAIMGFANENVGQAYQRAWELCQSGGDYVKRMTTIQLLFSYYANIADFETAERMTYLLKQSLEELDEVVPEYALQVHWGYGYLESTFGRHQSVAEHFEKAISYYNQITEHTTGDRVGLDSGVFCHGWAGLHSNWLGYPDTAKEYVQAALQIAAGLNTKLSTKDALWFAAWVSLEMEDMDAARQYTEALLELTTKEHYFLFEAMARTFVGRILLRDGKHQEAIASIQTGLDMFHMTGMVTSQTVYLYAQAEAYCAAGRVEDGLEVVAKAEKIEHETGEERYKSAVQRIKGDLYLLAEEETAAEQAYLNAIAVAQEQSGKLLELQAVKRLASLWQQQGKGSQARRMLGEVYDWFTEGFDTPILVEAREMLEGLPD